jgi:bacteriocin-like protein
MLNLSEELKTKLLSAKSAEEVAEIIKADGQEIRSEDVAHIWKEIADHREEEKTLSIDELETISGGADRNWVESDCAATVEPYSWCGSNDACIKWDVTYEYWPQDERCPNCGIYLYRKQDPFEAYYKTIPVRHICKKCGYNYIHHYV